MNPVDCMNVDKNRNLDILHFRMVVNDHKIPAWHRVLLTSLDLQNWDLEPTFGTISEVNLLVHNRLVSKGFGSYKKYSLKTCHSEEN